MTLKTRLYAATTGLFMAGLVATTFTVTTPGQAEAKHLLSCKPYVGATARASRVHFRHLARRIARKRAIRKWSRKARHRYGFRYRSWYRAKGKHLHCEGAAGSIYCTVRARPCRIVFPLTLRKAP